MAKKHQASKRALASVQKRKASRGTTAGAHRASRKRGPGKPAAAKRLSPAVPELRARLAELEETLRAIRSGEVDALLVSGSQGDRIFTLQGAEHPYRVMVEALNVGAATLSRDGVVLYANHQFAEMLDMPLEQLIGSASRDTIRTSEHIPLGLLLQRVKSGPQKMETHLQSRRGRLIPVYLSFSELNEPGFEGFCIIVTDLTEQAVRQKALAQSNESLKLAILKRESAETALRREEEALRQLSSRLLRLQDEERRRTARLLEEGVSQTLADLVVNLDQLASLLGNHQPEGAKILAESLKLAGRAKDETRDISHVLHPPDLDELGLPAAIKWYAKQFMERTKIKVDLELLADMPTVPQATKMAIFRIVQESLANVRRHSGSPTARIKLDRLAGELIVEVEDKGRGSRLELLSNESEDSIVKLGSGIFGMRERLRQLGGRLQVVSSSAGTTVKAAVPLGVR